MFGPFGEGNGMWHGLEQANWTGGQIGLIEVKFGGTAVCTKAFHVGAFMRGAKGNLPLQLTAGTGELKWCVVSRHHAAAFLFAGLAGFLRIFLTAFRAGAAPEF